MNRKILWGIILAAVLVSGTVSYLTPRLIQATQVNLNTGTEPRSLSDIINFTQKTNLAEQQLTPGFGGWELALRTVNRYFGTSQVYKEGCTKYNCSGGPALPKDVETATVAVGASPLGVGVNPTTNRVYVTNFGANSVFVIDGATNAVLATIPVGTNPIGVGVNPATNRVYVANSEANSVSVIDATGNTVLTTVLGVSQSLGGVVVNPATNRVYVAGASVLSVIDGGTNTVLTTITGVGPGPSGVGVNPTTNLVYAANLAGSLSVINGTSNTIIKTITVGSGALGVGVNPTTNRVYVEVINPVGVFAIFGLSVIDGSTNTVLTTIPNALIGGGVGVNTISNRLYASGGSRVSVINGTSNTIINTVTVGTTNASLSNSFKGLFNVGVNPNTNRVYVSNSAENTTSVIGQREEIREACLQASGSCLVVSSIGTLFPGTLQSTPVSLVAVSLRSNATKTGTQMSLTVVCDNDTTNPNQQCSAFYVDGNVWGPDRQDLTKSPFIILNAEPYFYLLWHWWDFANSRIVVWGYWWNDSHNHPNWYWGVYWWWRTYVNYYIGIWLPWWWWVWHWTYWRYWFWWSTSFST